MNTILRLPIQPILSFWPLKMPPRKSKKKQTRLAFAASTAAPSADVSPEQSNRYATLTYGNPSLGTYRPPKTSKSKPETSPEKKRPKLPTKTRSNDKPTSTMMLFPLDATRKLRSKRWIIIEAQSDNDSLDEPIIPASQKRKQAAPPDNLEVLIHSPPKLDNPKMRRNPAPGNYSDPYNSQTNKLRTQMILIRRSYPGRTEHSSERPQARRSTPATQMSQWPLRSPNGAGLPEVAILQAHLLYSATMIQTSQ
jgi:hypothetical protein